MPCGTPSACLGVGEDVVPQPRLEVRLHLRQVEVGPAAARRAARGRCGRSAGRSRPGPRPRDGRRPVRCASSKCQPRGRARITGVLAGSASGVLLALGRGERDACRRTASCRVTWPPTTLRQCGVLASSRSASHTRAPELRALIAIFGSVGPVISTRRSRRSAGAGATVQSDSRTSAVSGRKSSRPVRAISSRRLRRAASSSSRRSSKRASRSATKASASGVSTSSDLGTGGADTSRPVMDATLAVGARRWSSPQQPHEPVSVTNRQQPGAAIWT